MRKWLLVTAILFLFQTAGNTQFLKSFQYEIEGGTGISVGPNTFNTIESEINPLSLQHFVHKRYKAPSLRIRGFAYSPVTLGLSIGVKAGVDVHYMEKNLFGEYETNLSLPIQLFTELKIMPVSKLRSLFVAGGIGSNLKWIRFGPFMEKGGILASIEASIKIPSQRHSFFYKLGFEYSEDHCSYHYVPFGTTGTEELFRYRQNRKQVYFGVGLKF